MMKSIDFVDVYELAEDLVSLTVESVETSVIGSFDTIEELLKALVSIDAAFVLKDISLCNPELDAYNDAYMLEIGTNWDIWVYPMFTGKQYLIGGTDILFVEKGYLEQVYENMDYDKLIKFDIEDMYTDDDCDGDCENCKYHNHEEVSEVHRNGNVETHEGEKSITQSWSSPDGNAYFSRSFYSSVEDEMEKVKAEWRRFAQMF